PAWQRGFDLFDFLFDGIDDGQRVLAVTHHDDAANDFAASVELGHPAPDIAAEMDGRYIFQIDWRAILDFEHDVLDVLDLFDVAAATDVILGGGDLECFAAHIGIAHLDRVDDVAERDVVSDQRVGIEIDLVLLHESADRRDFRHAFDCGKRVTQVPILNRTELGQIVFARVINQRVFVNPADRSRVRADHGIHTLGERPAHRIQILDDPRARPIDVRAVFKNDVNKRFAEHRFAANKLYFRHGNEDAGNRIRDLIFDKIRRASFPLGVNDHLHVAQIGNGIQRRVKQPVNPSRDAEDGENENQKFISRAPLDDAVDKHLAPINRISGSPSRRSADFAPQN